MSASKHDTEPSSTRAESKRDRKEPKQVPVENGTPPEYSSSENGQISESETASSNEPTSNGPPLPDEPTPDGPPLPDEPTPNDPPLPQEALPSESEDGWEPVWDPNAQAFYFYNRFTQATQWDNPRVPEASSSVMAPPPGLGSHDPVPSSSVGAPGTEPLRSSSPVKRPHGGYNPAIHGDYDPTADYAIAAQAEEEAASVAYTIPSSDPAALYAATGTFNRYTGRWQDPSLNPERHNDENKSKRQMNAYFDVDAAANSHDGKSLKAERQSKKLTKQEIKAFKNKRREKKEEKRRAWLRD
ncbi:hypothetical protein H2201_007292 [Coniosporium apollinis]|uniref:WW domain-containing protein n=1 Tax=Coniosporium apollinis TaxID=61459 RepID=A0ABQ9NJL9_9PEZI|nr:hypothetical protein H2201_007292 [Coniosporium apollinis]